MKFPEIPITWIITLLAISMVVMRCFGIDTWTTAALSLIMGWLTGVKFEQGRQK